MRIARVLIGLLLVLVARDALRACADDSIYLTPPDSILGVADYEADYGYMGPLRRWVASHPARDAADKDGFILTDRPSFSNANTVVPYGWAQLETGYQYTLDHDQNGVARGSHNTPQINLRVGILERVELRILWNGTNVADVPNAIPASPRPHSSNVQAGFKFLASEQEGWIPLSAVVATVFLPTSEGEEVRSHDKRANYSHNVAPFIDYIYGWAFEDERWTLVGSTGGVFNGKDSKLITEYFQSAVLQFDYSKKWSVYYEMYIIFDKYQDRSESSSYCDAGVLWRPRKNLQLDWRAGWGLNATADDFFTGVGASFRY